MQNALNMQSIDDFARDAIADLDDSVLNTIRGITTDELSDDFVSQIEQYLRVKILYSYEGDNL